MQEKISKEIKKKEEKIDKIVQKNCEKNEEKCKKIENFVNAIYQNLSTALQSIDEMQKICKDSKFLQELKNEQLGYEKIKNSLLNACLTLSVKPKDNNMFEKARLFTSIKLTTIQDKSTRHLAEMMLVGTVMGSLTCYKDLCDHRGVDATLYEILNKLMKMEEENFNSLKKFLKEM